MQQGYKQTQIGIIPEDWEEKRLSQLFTIGHGKDQREIETKTGKYPILATSGVIGYADNYLWDKPSALIGRKGTINKPQYIETPFWTIDTLFYTKIYDTVCPKFVYYLFCTIDWLSLNEASGVPSLNANNIEKIIAAVPSHAEQKQIAGALSDVDSMISSLEKLIAKKKAIKQGAMQELLTGKKRLPGFTGKWKTMPLGEIGVITGSGVDKKILPDELPITLLNYTNVYHQISIVRKDLNHRVTASIEKIKNCFVLKGDVFLTPTSETPEDIALSAVASEDMNDVVYSYHVVRLRPNCSHNGSFINYALSTPMFREQAVQFAEGSGIRYVITLKKFKEMRVYLPVDKTEQDTIVSILSDMDNEIEALEQKLAKARQIKQGMMQQLLTGKIRLV